MRIYDNFTEAFSEIKRDLAEMGVTHHTETMQDKYIGDDRGFDTRELTNYMFTVTNPKFEDLHPIQPWADEEWAERLAGIRGHPVNPGLAWKLREHIWREFLHAGKFGYTYSSRFSWYRQVESIIKRLLVDPGSRQLYVSMWTQRDSASLGTIRVPCSLGWHFMFRGGALNMCYFMRSCDFFTHFQNDIFLSMKLQEHVAEQSGHRRGHYTQYMGSLHVYQKDVSDVF